MYTETKTQVVSLESLVAHPENYNRHPPEQIGKIRQSLRAHGQVRSVVVQDNGDGETYTITAGHGVVRAAQLEGWEEIRAEVIPAGWPPEKVKAYLVADNELGRQSTPDNVQLASLLEEVRAFDETLLMAAGYTEEEFHGLLEEIGAVVPQQVEMKPIEVKPPPALVWVLIGMPLVGYGRIADLVEEIAKDPEVTLATTVADDDGNST